MFNVTCNATWKIGQGWSAMTGVGQLVYPMASIDQNSDSQGSWQQDFVLLGCANVNSYK